MQEKLEKRSFISFPYFFCNKNNKIKDESIGSKGRHTLDMDLQKKGKKNHYLCSRYLHKSFATILCILFFPMHIRFLVVAKKCVLKV